MWTYIKLLLLGSVIVILIYYRMSNSLGLSGKDINLYEVLELDKGIQLYSKIETNFYPIVY